MTDTPTNPDGELDDILELFRPAISTWISEKVSQEEGDRVMNEAKTALLAWRDAYTKRKVAEATQEAYELLYWKYKELNHQTVDMKFVEAYNTLTKESEATE